MAFGCGEAEAKQMIKRLLWSSRDRCHSQCRGVWSDLQTEQGLKNLQPHSRCT